MTTTASLEQRIRDLEVKPRTVACVWLGQAGYLFKSPQGVIVMIDPYLSDYALDQWGMERVLPPPIDPEHLHPDLLLISHWHEDHMDAPLVRTWGNVAFPGIFAGPETCTPRALAWGWPSDKVRQLNLGQSLEHRDVAVTACFARHEIAAAPAPEAVSFLLDIDGVRLWDVADTEYDARLRPMKDERLDVAFWPINGVGGNMTADEAAFLAWQVEPRISVPMHYNMWAPETFGPGATLDPQGFRAMYERLGGRGEVRILEVGEIVTFSAR